MTAGDGPWQFHFDIFLALTAHLPQSSAVRDSISPTYTLPYACPMLSCP